MNTADFIWMDGEFVAWEDAKVHVLSHSLHYGNAAIEGTKAYKTDKGYAIFKLREHTQRLLNSSKMTLMNVPFTLEELEAAQVELIKKNGFKGDSVYLRPLVYLGYGVMGLYHANAPVKVSISAWEWGAYLGEEGLRNGIRLKISSLPEAPTNRLWVKRKQVRTI